MVYFAKAWLLLSSIVLFRPSYAHNFPKLEVVMRSPESIAEMNEGEFPTYHGGTCTIRFSRDGNLATQNGFNTGGWDANQNSQCSGSGGPDMTYKLQSNGNLVAKCGSSVDYRTNSNQEQSDYFLAIDDTCKLHIYKGTLDCNSVKIEDEMWTNIKTEWRYAGQQGKMNRLGKGEYVRFDDGSRLVMQSYDGNLVLYSGTYSDENEALWGANQESSSVPFGWAPGTDFYANIHANGHLTMTAVDYESGSATKYFDKDLGSGGAPCYKVVYDEHINDLVAEPVPCATRRERYLRGEQN